MTPGKPFQRKLRKTRARTKIEAAQFDLKIASREPLHETGASFVEVTHGKPRALWIRWRRQPDSSGSRLLFRNGPRGTSIRTPSALSLTPAPANQTAADWRLPPGCPHATDRHNECRTDALRSKGASRCHMQRVRMCFKLHPHASESTARMFCVQLAQSLPSTLLVFSSSFPPCNRVKSA